jgi:hypothetical protein
MSGFTGMPLMNKGMPFGTFSKPYARPVSLTRKVFEMLVWVI